mmetsp:Transcript_6297/g.9157  ORF Transcript_6297/g.9157 Transcript_6297/m.9157 type:complete len:334 (+) Transcript_6297:1109-2110(+)
MLKLIFIFLFFIYCIYAHEIPSNLKAFDLDPDSQRMVTVSSKNGNSQCVFTFNTVECSKLSAKPIQRKVVKPKPTKPKKKVSMQTKESYLNIKNNLASGCTQLDKGYWTYKVCFGGEITQYHAQDVYILGKYPGSPFLKDTSLSTTYGSGQYCEPQQVDRQTKLNFFCTETLRIIDVSEPSQCHYEIDIGHPRLCGPSSPFPKGRVIEHVSHTSGGGSNPTVRMTKDPFLLSMETIPSSSGSSLVHECSLKSTLHDLKQSPSVCFSSFSLEIKHSSDVSSSSSSSLSFVAHSSFLERVPSSSISKQASSISSSSSFRGSPLEFLSISLKDDRQ